MSNPAQAETTFPDPEEALARLDEELRFRAYAETTRRTYRFHVQLASVHVRNRLHRSQQLCPLLQRLRRERPLCAVDRSP